MPSEIKLIPGLSSEAYELDCRYGQTRRGFRRETAEEMARVDELIEAAGVKPGDRIEVLWKSSCPTDEPIWKTLEGLTFLEIDNGRFRVTDSAGNRSGYGLQSILDVRKAND